MSARSKGQAHGRRKHRRKQTFPEMAFGRRERRQHRVGNGAAGEEVAGGDRTIALREGMCPERAGTGEGRRSATRVDRGELPELGMRPRRDKDIDRFRGARAERHQVERASPERRVGDVLAGNRADAGASMRAACGDSGRGR
jgi:hypothetical protein